jgi:hypothetical protein
MADDKTRPGGKRLQRVISWIERPMGKWDKDPFFPDGGDGRIEEDQTVWLHPYWLGRYHRIIE